MVLGAEKVGKTSLIVRYLKRDCPKEHDPTVEDEYKAKIRISKDQSKEFKILDTAGKKEYQNNIDHWIDSADGFILVFSIEESNSFESIKELYEKIKQRDACKAPIILVGNKCDQNDKRVISEKQGNDLAKSIDGEYYETSSLNNLNGNVEAVFQRMGKIISRDVFDEDEKCKCVICSIF